MIYCQHCKRDAIACDCIGMGDKLRTVYSKINMTLVTNILIERQRLGKDLPRKCAIAGCTLDPMFIPVLHIPARKQINRREIVYTAAEMLNHPLCHNHKESAKLSDFFDHTTYDVWAKHLADRKLRAPIMERARITFRPLVIKPIIIAP